LKTNIIDGNYVFNTNCNEEYNPNEWDMCCNYLISGSSIKIPSDKISTSDPANKYSFYNDISPSYDGTNYDIYVVVTPSSNNKIYSFYIRADV
jgi:hypothetical protein